MQRRAEDNIFAPLLRYPTGQHPVLTAGCHAGARMPEKLDNLAPKAADPQRRIAWNPAPLKTAAHLFEIQNEPVVMPIQHESMANALAERPSCTPSKATEAAR